MRHHVEIYVQDFIVNNVNQLRKVIFVAYENTKNILSIIVNIITRVAIHQNYNEKTLFIFICIKKKKK